MIFPVALQLFKTSYLIGPLWVADFLFSGSREVFPELQGHLARRRCDRLTSTISPNLNRLTGGLSGNGELVAGYY